MLTSKWIADRRGGRSGETGADPNLSLAPDGETDRGAESRMLRPVFSNVPSLSVPKGGGAIRSIGEKVGVNVATGTASFTIPLPVSPGRGAPDLALSYESGAGASIFGWGWRLALPVISRRTDRGLPLYLDDDASETFILSGAEDLVPLLQDDGPRRTRRTPSSSSTATRRERKALSQGSS